MNSETTTPVAAPRNARPSIRWWPAILVVTLAALAIALIRGFKDIPHQERNIRTTFVGIITLLLLLIWWVFFSRAYWTVRWSVLGSLLVGIAATAGLFKIRGVTGDLLPILQPRWKRPARVSSAAPMSSVTSVPEPPPGARDYPQFLGPQRNATVDGPELARDWNKQPPEKIWRHPVGAAWSGFAVKGRRAITQEQQGEKELIVCYDLVTGQPLWSHGYVARYFTTLAGEGPRATPTIAGDRVLALGATGILSCLDLASGQLRWAVDIILYNHGAVLDWGMSGSPLVTNGLVIVSAGGHPGRSLVAYRLSDGGFVWSGGDDHAGFSSPGSVMLAGVGQILIFNAHGLAAHDPASGKVLWDSSWPGGHPHVAMPVVLPGDRVFISSGYGTGGAVLQVTNQNGQWSATRVWKSPRLKAKFTNVIHLDGFIYGLDDGIMACLDAATGEQKWKEGRYGHGQEILAGRLLLVLAESGEVVLIEPVPQALRELTRFPALAGKTWNPPALAGEYLLVRNDREAACHRLPVVNR